MTVGVSTKLPVGFDKPPGCMEYVGLTKFPVFVATRVPLLPEQMEVLLTVNKPQLVAPVPAYCEKMMF